jgi:hypothetical protein
MANVSRQQDTVAAMAVLQTMDEESFQVEYVARNIRPIGFARRFVHSIGTPTRELVQECKFMGHTVFFPVWSETNVSNYLYRAIKIPRPVSHTKNEYNHPSPS